MKKMLGFTLIELIIFIAIIGLALAILIPLAIPLQHIHEIDKQNQAIELATQRMEIILFDYRKNGFDTFIDPCSVASPPQMCNTSNQQGSSISPSGFLVTSNDPFERGNLDQNGWTADPGGNYKKIDITIKDTSNNTLATLSEVVADY